MLPRCRPHRGLHGRKHIRRGQCASSSAFRLAVRWNDILARLIGQWLSERLRQPFIIENRPGAGSNIGTELAVHAAPDGYSLLLVGPTAAINATLYEKLNFNFARDIAPVAGIVRVPNVMLSESLGSCQVGSRIHRVCQGQSGQAQHGVGWEWDRRPRGRRAV